MNGIVSVFQGKSLQTITIPIMIFSFFELHYRITSLFVNCRKINLEHRSGWNFAIDKQLQCFHMVTETVILTI